MPTRALPSTTTLPRCPKGVGEISTASRLSLEENMKAKVTENGVVVPKEFFEGTDEVEIQKENGVIMIVPIIHGDTILELGKHPITCGVPDASEHHDRYLYGS